MTGTLTDRDGFEHPNRKDRSPRRYAASLELMACVALVVSTIVAATAVSIGIARAAGAPFGLASPPDSRG